MTRSLQAAAFLCPLVAVALLLPAPLAAQRGQEADGRQRGSRPETGNQPDSQESSPARVGSRTTSGAQRQIQFNAAGHPWLDLLEWFAGEAGTTLTWRDLPEGEVNLLTNDSYTIPEAFNLINMHLLPRGFTLIQKAEGLFLVELGESLNPSMVPRVTPEELDRRGPYEYVKVSIPLDWLLAEDAAEELAPILSPYGKIIPLRATNRIEAMDAVANLREMRDLVYREQSEGGEERLVDVFHLEHATAFDVANKLRSLLGMQTALTDMNEDQLEVMERQYEYQSELVDRLGDRAPVRRDGGEGVHLVANERTNSILVNASPDKIAIIRQAIPLLDVPQSDQGVRLNELTSMKVYSLKGADPDAIVDILEDLRDIGKLHPSARFSEDDDRQIIFAYASLQDHLTIRSVRDQLAGSARTFHMIELKRLRAAQVAEQIRSMTEGSGGGGGRRRRGGGGGDWEGFQLQADARANRLLLFATPAEMEHVESLLVTLGERPASSGAGSVRRIQASGASADEILRRLREIWPSLRSNPLRIDVPRDAQPGGRTLPPAGLPPTDSPAETGQSDSRAQLQSGMAGIVARKAVLAQPSRDRSASATAVAMMQTEETQTEASQSGAVQSNSADPTQTTQDDRLGGGTANQPRPPQRRIPAQGAAPGRDSFPPQGDSGTQSTFPNQDGFSPQGAFPNQGPPDQGAFPGQDGFPSRGAFPARRESPVIIRSDGAGGLILSSQDTEALDMLEGLLAEMMPPQQQSYSVFRLENASPYTVQTRLLEIYSSGATGAVSPLNFVADLNTKSIMVFGANNVELDEIGRIVEFYDKTPPQPDEQIIREPQRFDLKHANAERVATVIEELYLDLLSANDRALNRGGRDGRDREESPAQAAFTSLTGMERRPVFQGMLSVATYPETNSIVVSAPTFLRDEIADVVAKLDVPRAATSVEVVQLNGLDSAFVGEWLNNVLSTQQSTQSAERDQRRDRNRRGDVRGARRGQGGGFGRRGR